MFWKSTRFYVTNGSWPSFIFVFCARGKWNAYPAVSLPFYTTNHHFPDFSMLPNMTFPNSHKTLLITLFNYFCIYRPFLSNIIFIFGYFKNGIDWEGLVTLVNQWKFHWHSGIRQRQHPCIVLRLCGDPNYESYDFIRKILIWIS